MRTELAFKKLYHCGQQTAFSGCLTAFCLTAFCLMGVPASVDSCTLPPRATRAVLVLPAADHYSVHGVRSSIKRLANPTHCAGTQGVRYKCQTNVRSIEHLHSTGGLTSYWYTCIRCTCCPACGGTPPDTTSRLKRTSELRHISLLVSGLSIMKGSARPTLRLVETSAHAS